MKLVNVKVNNVCNMHSLDVGGCFQVPQNESDLFMKVAFASDNDEINCVNLRTGWGSWIELTTTVIKRDDLVITKEE